MTSTPAPSTPPVGTQVVPSIWTQRQQCTVVDTYPNGDVAVQSNVQPLSVVLYPGEYVPGVVLTKLSATYVWDECPEVLVSVHMAKDGPCGWCDQPGTWDVRLPGAGQWVDVACNEHLAEHFPCHRAPVSLVKPGVPVHGVRPTEADLRNRRQPGPVVWAYAPVIPRALINNDPHVLATVIQVAANLR